MKLENKNILITGGAKRIGKHLAMACAREGANIIIHHSHSDNAALETKMEIEKLGVKSHIIQFDFNNPMNIKGVIKEAEIFGSLFGLVNNAAIFEAIQWDSCDLTAWNKHLNINLTAPFFLCQEFANNISTSGEGRIVNILDWRALRPGVSHLPYTISKAGLAALTKSLALALAPQIIVNGIALGAILPPTDGGDIQQIFSSIPARRWASIDEVEAALLFLLSGPSYITGEIIHVDGGRHLI